MNNLKQDKYNLISYIIMSLIYLYINHLEIYFKNFIQNISDYTNLNNFLFQLRNKYND